MINFNKLLRESREQKFDAIADKKESKVNPYSCNYSPVSHHRFCEHEHCILDPDWIAKDKEQTLLHNELKSEEAYLQHGKDTVGYNRVEVYKNILKLKKLLGERRR